VLYTGDDLWFYKISRWPLTGLRHFHNSPSNSLL